MPIWEYKKTSNCTKRFWNSETCPFCKILLESFTINEEYNSSSLHGNYVQERKMIFFCLKCGWWLVTEKSDTAFRFGTMHYPHHDIIESAAAASLMELDLTDINLPLTDIKNYLLVKYEKRFNINPRVFEELVCSVFKDLGFHAITTAYSGDNGIDVILNDGRNNIGVQVKRYKNRIQIEQIRSLVGALVFNDMTTGIFLTTSDFTNGAYKTTTKYKEKGYKIELVDAMRFYKDLELTQRKTTKSREEILSYIPSNIEFKVVEEDSYSEKEFLFF